MNLIRLSEAARSLGLAASTLRWQIKNGRFHAIRVDGDWWVKPEEVERYRSTHRRPERVA